MKFSAVCCVLLAAAVSTTAFAADNSLTGIYAGVHLGQANASMTNEDTNCWTDCSAYTQRPTGTAYGIQAGQNFASGSLLFGYQGDFTRGAGLDEKVNYDGTSYAASSKFDYAFSLRGKVGLLVNDTALSLTYGPAWGKFESSLYESGSTNTLDGRVPGYVYGISVEHAFQKNLILSADFSSYTFRDVKEYWYDPTINSQFSRYQNSVDTARIALNYKF